MKAGTYRILVVREENEQELLDELLVNIRHRAGYPLNQSVSDELGACHDSAESMGQAHHSCSYIKEADGDSLLTLKGR